MFSFQKKNIHSKPGMVWYMNVVLGRQGQVNHEFKATMSYTASSRPPWTVFEDSLSKTATIKGHIHLRS